MIDCPPFADRPFDGGDGAPEDVHEEQALRGGFIYLFN